MNNSNKHFFNYLYFNLSFLTENEEIWPYQYDRREIEEAISRELLRHETKITEGWDKTSSEFFSIAKLSFR